MSRRKYFTNRKKQKNIIKKRKLLPKSQPTSLKISVPLYKIKLNRKIICKSSHLPDGWSTVNNSNHTVFCYIQQSSPDPCIIYTVTLYSDLSYRIKAFNHNINLPNQVKITNPTDLTNILNYVTSLKVCPGNPDLEFLQLAEKKETKTFSDAHGKLELNLNFHFKIKFNLNNRSNHCSCRRIPVQNNQTHQLPHAAIKSFKMQRLHLIQEKSTIIDIEK